MPKAIRVDAYDASGNRLGAGPLHRVSSVQYSDELDRVGAFALRMPASDERIASLIASAYELRIVVEGEGEVYRGIVREASWTTAADGGAELAISGDSIARELVHANALLGREYSGDTLADAVADLVSDTDWSAGDLDTPTTLLTARFDGSSIFVALRKVAEIFGLSLRTNGPAREVDVGDFSAVASGLRLVNVEALSPALEANTAVKPLSSIRINEDRGEIWNTVVPLGGGEGVNKLDLRYATRSTANGDAYDVASATGPDGRTYYYLQDASSVTAHGARTQVVAFKDVIPLANTAAGFEAAANALYDLAVAWLVRRKDRFDSYDVAVSGLSAGQHAGSDFELGETIRLVYRGLVERDAGPAVFKDVDVELAVRGYTRRISEQDDSTTLTVASVARTPDPDEALARVFEDVRAMEVAPRPYTFVEPHGPSRESIASGFPVTFPIVFDSKVTYLHQATLRVTLKPVRSNVSVAAESSDPSPPPGEPVGSPWVTTSSSAGSATTDANGGHDHAFVDGNTLVGGGTLHSHDLSTVDMAAEGDHTHGVTLGTHNHEYELPTHDHDLTYGIYDGPSPSTPGITVTINGTSRTVALGGPWNADFTVDITQYLQDADGHPLRQANTVVFTSSELIDLEVSCRSLVTATSIVPV